MLGSESGTAYLLRLPQGEVLARWKPHGDSVTASAFLSPTLFVTGSRDRTLRFWQWTGGEPKAGDDAADARFFTRDEAMAAVEWDETRRVIEQAFDRIAA